MPASYPEHLADLAGHQAGRAGQVVVAVAERDATVGGSDVVPADVAPASLGWMGDLTVKLDDQRILLVQHVAVRTLALSFDPDLAFAPGQAVRSLHEAQIAVFERRVHSGLVWIQHLGDLSTP